VIGSASIPFQQRLWSELIQRIILPIGDQLYGQRMMQRLAFLRQAQWWSQAQIEDYRAASLSELIRVAYGEVPFYRRLMEGAGLRPQDIRHPKDLHKLPIVTKDMLRSGYPSETVRYTGQPTYEACSSGSTGAPFCVAEDNYTAGWYRAAFLLALEWAGWPIGVPHVQTGMTLSRPRGRRLKDLLLRCHYVSAYDLTDRHLDAVLEDMDRRGIQFLWGYPGSLYFLAQWAAKRGWNRSLRAIATWGDNLYTHYRAAIEAAFGCKVFDQYGIGEGVMIAAQCGQGCHYHQFDTDVILEFVDDDEQPVGSGEVGHILVTRLHPGPMPLIRYRVGDIGIPGGEGACACGRAFRIMESIQGRDTDIITTPSGNRLIVHFFTGILEYYPEIDTFQVVQEEPDSIVLKLVPRGMLEDNLIRKVVSQLKDRGADLNIRVEVVSEIPLPPNGKRRFVISRLGDSTSRSTM
jgi:phenylacetate-CoA ligase